MVTGSTLKKTVQLDQGLAQHKVAAICQTRFAHTSSNKPKTALIGLVGNTERAWLVLYGSPWFHMYFHCHQTITHTWPKASKNRDFAANARWPGIG